MEVRLYFSASENTPQGTWPNYKQLICVGTIHDFYGDCLCNSTVRGPKHDLAWFKGKSLFDLIVEGFKQLD